MVSDRWCDEWKQRGVKNESVTLSNDGFYQTCDFTANVAPPTTEELK